MNKISGETKLMLIMGAIVLLGGGFLAFGPKGGDPTSGGAPPPIATPPPLKPAEFETILKNSDHVKGPENAEVAIIEFADLECNSCRYAYHSVSKDFGKKLPVRFAFHHFPLENHATAKPAACALEAAHKQGKFWEMYDALFEEKQPILDTEYFEARAKKLGLNKDQFVRDALAPDATKRVENSQKLGARLGVEQTPTFFVFHKKTGEVKSAIGTRELLPLLQGVPGAPTPLPPSPAPR